MPTSPPAAASWGAHRTDCGRARDTHTHTHCLVLMCVVVMRTRVCRPLRGRDVRVVVWSRNKDTHTHTHTRPRTHAAHTRRAHCARTHGAHTHCMACNNTTHRRSVCVRDKAGLRCTAHNITAAAPATRVCANAAMSEKRGNFAGLAFASQTLWHKSTKTA